MELRARRGFPPICSLRVTCRKPFCVKASSGAEPVAGGPRGRRSRRLAPWLLAGCALLLAGCGGKRNGIDLAKAPAAGLTNEELAARAAEPPPPPDPHAALLGSERVIYRDAGYTLRVPLGWGEADRTPSSAIELFLAKPGTGQSIAVSRQQVTVRTYTEWKDLTENFMASLKGTLKEPRIQRQEMAIHRGAIAFDVEHTHQADGTFYYSRKMCLFGGKVIVTIDCNAPLGEKAAAEPLFAAFLDAFELLDTSGSRLEHVRPDFIGQYRDPQRGFTIPVQRRFVRNDPKGSTSVIARWVDPPNTTVAVAEHLYQHDDLEFYGDFQQKVLAEGGNTQISGERINAEGKTVYRLLFTTPNGFRTALFIIPAPDRFYQVILSSDAFSFPYLQDLGLKIVALARFG